MSLFPPMLRSYPGMVGDWVGVAFVVGDVRQAGDDFVMMTTRSSLVHAELVVGRGPFGTAYSSFAPHGFVRSRNQHYPGRWKVLALPAADMARVQGMALHLVSLGLPYDSADLWQCCVKFGLPFERELDCHRPETWSNGVFCSQMCLLVLRRLIREGVVQAPPAVRERVEAVHSRGCSPGTLYWALKGCQAVY